MAANGIVDSSHDAVSVTIPAEFVEDFRAALLTEIRFEAEQITDHVERESPGDVPPTAELLWRDVRLLEKFLENEGVPGDVQLRAEDFRDLDMIAHAFEAMCREVVGPRVQAEMETTPIDAGSVPELRAVMERLSWAADRAQEFHAKAAEARTVELGAF